MLHDKDIREFLFEFLEQVYGKVRILEEKVMGRSRADVVMVTDLGLYGIEIKSDADTYARLASQVKDYDKYFDFNMVVVGTSHAMNIEAHVPDYWGIVTVELLAGKPDFYILRSPQQNPKVNWKKKLEILWRPELAILQEQNGMPKYKDKSKLFVKNKIIELMEKGKIEEYTLKCQVSEVLFERDYENVEKMLAEYRKGELQKKIEKETDPEKKQELLLQQERAKNNFKDKNIVRRRRRRRRRTTKAE